MITFKNILVSLLLISAIGLTTWSLNIIKETSPLLADNQFNQPDTILEDVTATIMNKDGTPTLKLLTPQMKHYIQNDATEITAPHLAIFRQYPEPWYIDADYAKTFQGISQVRFWNNVVIRHAADKANPNTSMKTTELTVFPGKKTAETGAAVEIIEPEAIIHAVGLLADLKDGTIKLLSQARGEYAPSS